VCQTLYRVCVIRIAAPPDRRRIAPGLNLQRLGNPYFRGSVQTNGSVCHALCPIESVPSLSTKSLSWRYALGDFLIGPRIEADDPGPARRMICARLIENQGADSLNLAVVCTNHHDRAHTRSELSRNLTPAVLREFKRNWEEAVKVLNVLASHVDSAVNSDA